MRRRFVKRSSRRNHLSWGREGERFAAEKPSLLAQLMLPRIVAVIVIGGAVRSGDWTLGGGVILFCLLLILFILEQDKETIYVLSDHRIFILRPRRQLQLEAFLLKDIEDMNSARESRILCSRPRKRAGWTRPS